MTEVVVFVEQPSDPSEWVAIGNMLATMTTHTNAEALHVSIRPAPVEPEWTVSEWLHQLAHTLHHMLPVPYYPQNVGDALYDLSLVPLNAHLTHWRLHLDLSRQGGLQLDTKSVQRCLTAELNDIMGSRCDDDRAKREWVMQLFESGHIQIRLPVSTTAAHVELLNAVLHYCHSFLHYVDQDESLRPTALRMLLEYGFPSCTDGMAQRIAQDVLRVVVHNTLRDQQ